MSADLLKGKAEAFLQNKFSSAAGQSGKGKWIEAAAGPWVYLNRSTARAWGVKQADAEEALADWLRTQKGVQAVYTRTQLSGPLPKLDAIGQSVRRSFWADRAGDLFVVLKPYHLLSPLLATGTNHGMPHDYDTHVPLVVYGPGVRPGPRRMRSRRRPPRPSSRRRWASSPLPGRKRPCRRVSSRPLRRDGRARGETAISCRQGQLAQEGAKKKRFSLFLSGAATVTWKAGAKSSSRKEITPFRKGQTMPRRKAQSAASPAPPAPTAPAPPPPEPVAAAPVPAPAAPILPPEPPPQAVQPPPTVPPASSPAAPRATRKPKAKSKAKTTAKTTAKAQAPKKGPAAKPAAPKTRAKSKK